MENPFESIEKIAEQGSYEQRVRIFLLLEGLTTQRLNTEEFYDALQIEITNVEISIGRTLERLSDMTDHEYTPTLAPYSTGPVLMVVRLFSDGLNDDDWLSEMQAIAKGTSLEQRDLFVPAIECLVRVCMADMKVCDNLNSKKDSLLKVDKELIEQLNQRIKANLALSANRV